MPDVCQCPHCRQDLPPDAPDGVCPRCVLGLGFGDRSADRADRRSEKTGARPTAAEAGTGPSPATYGTTTSDRFAPPDPDNLARDFPHLEILELLGQGGMGAVYKARQRRLDRLVALKVLPPEVAGLPGFEERFTREARALARLNHPNIVTLHDFGEAGGLYYFLMEFVDGVNLRQLIAGGTLEPRQALAIVPQVCEALQYAHDAGVVHRDIKPENLLVDKKGRVKIADFGLVKLMSQREGTAGRAAFVLTGSQQVMGTPHYMAPEQMERPQAVDHRADIYSLGVVFYEMLTGELPLGRFAPPSRMVQIDARLDDVVLRALEKEPALRYQQVSEVKTDVESIAWQRPVTPSAKLSFGSAFDELNFSTGWSHFARSAAAYGPARAGAYLRSCLGLVWGVMLLVAAGCLLGAWLFVKSLAGPSTGPRSEPLAATAAPQIQVPLEVSIPRPARNWMLEDSVPALTEEFARNVLQLDPQQHAEVNTILQTIYERSLALEASHNECHIDDEGHLVVTIKPYPKAIAKLEDQLWSELDQKFNVQQQMLARNNLRLDAPRFPSSTPIANSDLAGPDFFRWGKDGARIELWNVGSWALWNVQSRGYQYVSRAPAVPEDYRRFLRGVPKPQAEPETDQLRTAQPRPEPDNDRVRPAQPGPQADNHHVPDRPSPKQP
jgi:serine/threonine protein kinase